MFFVMLNHPNKNVHAVPLMATDDDLAFFETQEAAREVAESNMLGEAFGYEIFELGMGEQ